MPNAGRTAALLGLLDEAIRAAADATELTAAGRTVLAAVCRTTGWPYGQLRLRSVPSGVWVGDADLAAAARYSPVGGAAERALATRAPVWTTDPAVEPLLERAGVGGACVIPVPGAEAALLFLSPDGPAPDDELLGVLAGVGAQLGRVAERAQAVELRAAYERERSAAARLAELHRAQDEAIATVSHELRTPLTSVAGYVEMLRDDIETLSEPHRQMVETIARNVRRLRMVADDLVVAHSMDAGPPTLALAPTSLPDLIKRAVTSTTPLAARRNQRIEAQIGPGVDLVPADGSQLTRAIAALLSNAVKFSPTGSPVSLSADNQGQEIDIRVTDYGSGIPAAELGLVFERFYRTETAHRQAVQGLGLGLTIARDIVEAHRGRLSAASVLGEGSTFTIHLPASQAGQR